MRKLLTLLSVSILTMSLSHAALATSSPKKVIVCKYVGTPFESELAQTGQNPISVSINALDDGFNGSFPYFGFKDQQENSVAVRYATGPTDNGTPEDCPTPDPEPVEVTAGVSFTDPTCENEEASLTLDEKEGVSYDIDGTVGAGETVTVTATAEEGFELVGQTVFEHTFGEVPEDCNPEEPIEVEASVDFIDPSCDSVDAVVLTGKTEGVTYTIEGDVAPGETVVVTAEAEEGFVLVGQSVFEYTFAEAPTDCDTEEPGDWEPDWTPEPDNDTPIGESPRENLAHTGGDVTVPAIIAGLLTALGLGSLAVSRKKLV